MIIEQSAGEQKPAQLQPHPCFHAEGAGKYGRIHLPVAADCNIQCNYCNRIYDCAHESRPGVTSELLEPVEAADRLDRVLDRMPWITVAGIAGPGDAFADPQRTLATLEQIRRRHGTIHLCLSTNGLALYEYIETLVDLKVGFVTITINAVNPQIGAQLYSWVRWQGQKITGKTAAALLFERQLQAIAKLKDKHITVKVNTVIIPKINVDHAEEIAKTLAAQKVDLHNLIAMIPVPGTRLATTDPPSRDLLTSLQQTAECYLPQMRHCMRCRADAVGLLKPVDTHSTGSHCSRKALKVAASPHM